MVKLIDKDGNVFSEGHCVRDILYDLNGGYFLYEVSAALRDGLWYIDDYCGEVLAYESRPAALKGCYGDSVAAYTIEGKDDLWYAVESDPEDNDWGMGSYDLTKAIKMAKECGATAQIAIINNGPDPICEDVITADEFDSYI